MIGFIILFCFIAFGFLFVHNRSLFIKYVGLCLIIFMGLRNPLDYIMDNITVYDIWVYYDHYSMSILAERPIGNFNSWEFSYNYLVFLCSKIIRWPQFILFLEAIIYISLMLGFINKYSKHIIVSIMCFLALGPWIFSLSAFRQAISIAIISAAIGLLYERKWIKYTLAVLFASTFHQTALLILPFSYFIMTSNSFRKKLICSLVIGGILFILGNSIFIFANTSFLRNSFEGRAVGSWLNGIINVILFLITIILASIGCRNNKDFKAQNEYLLFFCIWGFFFYIMRYQTQLFERISFYFFPCLCVLLPNSISNYFSNVQYKKWSLVALTILCVFLYFKRSFEIFYSQTYIL